MSTTQRKPGGKHTDWLPEEFLRPREALRDDGRKESIVVVVEEAADLDGRVRNLREVEEFGNLTPRLQEVLRMIADGWSTKQIAVHLKITRKTVEFHRSRLTKQLGIRSIALLARYAVRVGATQP